LSCGVVGVGRDGEGWGDLLGGRDSKEAWEMGSGGTREDAGGAGMAKGVGWVRWWAASWNSVFQEHAKEWDVEKAQPETTG